jgi:hypothetical protein
VPELAITETKPTSYGYSFIRSDGRPFFMLNRDNGGASVYMGVHGRPPQEDVGGLSVDVSDKAQAAKDLILAFRSEPPCAGG